MGMFSAESLNSFDDLYLMQLRDLHSAESQLIEALPKMAQATTHPELRQAFEDHLVQTQQHKARLEEVFHALGEDPGGHTCEAMKGLIKEGNEVIGADADPGVRDAALIAAAQRVEHYEMAGYGCAATFAERLGRTEDKALLGQTLDEEKEADSLLTRIAEQVVNPDAVRA
ncbi:MAG TPA: ferritin-like domain-containing protein [Rubricoccaceae bacterium]|nr:ferritin-like domain-containing protein [Rubricoccaceae bacterium]